jgi:hypothetical protein
VDTSPEDGGRHEALDFGAGALVAGALVGAGAASLAGGVSTLGDPLSAEDDDPAPGLLEGGGVLVVGEVVVGVVVVPLGLAVVVVGALVGVLGVAVVGGVVGGAVVAPLLGVGAGVAVVGGLVVGVTLDGHRARRYSAGVMALPCTATVHSGSLACRKL